MRTDWKILDEIHDIRHEIYNEIKDMTPAEKAAHQNKSARAGLEKYGIKAKFLSADPRWQRSRVGTQ